MSLATLGSRLLGYGRDALAATLFGASTYSDAFVVAFRLPNLLRDLFAEGALSAAIIPGLARARQKGGEAEAWRLASAMLSALAMVLAVLVLLGIWAAPLFLRWMVPGFLAHPGQFELALRLTRLLFPFIGFVGVAALLMGSLNSRRQFLAPALAPASMNVVMIAFGLFICPRLGPQLDRQVTGWALGALLGGATQCLIQVPAAWRAGFRWRPRWPWAEPEVRRVLSQMLPSAIGLSTTQVNLVVNTLLASQLAAGTVSCLYYGNSLMQLPLGIFGVAIANAVLPDLAIFHVRADGARFKQTLSFGLRLALFLTLPCLIGLIGLALPINVLLFAHGNFSVAAAAITASISIAYSLGIVFASWIKVIVPAYYALGSPSTAVRISLGMMVLNFALNLLLWKPFGALGLALSSTLVALLQVLLLLWLFRRKVGALFVRSDLFEAGRILLAATGLALGLWLARQSLSTTLPGWEMGQQGRLCLLALVGTLVLGGALLYSALSVALGLQSLIPEHFWKRGQPEGQVAKTTADAYDEA